MTIGPDGKPKIKQFGIVRSLGDGMMHPSLTAEREPLAEVITLDKDVKVTVEMPGISKQEIRINAYNDSIEVYTIETSLKKYLGIIETLPETDNQSAKSTYTNGILEITFKKKGRPISFHCNEGKTSFSYEALRDFCTPGIELRSAMRCFS
jgi:HSP20 family protein